MRIRYHDAQIAQIRILLSLYHRGQKVRCSRVQSIWRQSNTADLARFKVSLVSMWGNGASTYGVAAGRHDSKAQQEHQPAHQKALLNPQSWLAAEAAAFSQTGNTSLTTFTRPASICAAPEYVASIRSIKAKGAKNSCRYQPSGTKMLV